MDKSLMRAAEQIAGRWSPNLRLFDIWELANEIRRVTGCDRDDARDAAEAVIFGLPR